MSLLTLIQSAASELGVTRPTSIISSQDMQVQQLLALAQKEGKELARRFDWQVLTSEATFTTLAAEQQTTLSVVAPDFGHIVNGTMWNRSQFWPVHGPLNAQEWQKRKAAAAQVGPHYSFRIRGDAVLFNPVPAAGETIYFEYVSSQWCQSSGGTKQSEWQTDTDVARIDEEIIRLGVVWRFRKAKGLDYGEDFRTYESALAQLFGQDGGKSLVDMTGEDMALYGATIADGSWPL